jgi:hypothetical protein
LEPSESENSLFFSFFLILAALISVSKH